MPSVTFDQVKAGGTYSRQELAKIWGYTSFHAIARGVVTPKNDKKIILFVTEEKQSTAEQYADKLVDNVLEWEGPTDHFAEGRMLNSSCTGEEIHLFHRVKHHTDFLYLGKLKVLDMIVNINKPSKFKLQISE